MTNEEAINTLKSLKDYYNDKNEDSYVGFDDEDNEALDIAIKALEQQPRWIPISEIGYPKPEDEYKHFITIDNKGEITIQEFLLSLDEEPQPYFSGMRNIIAYMPPLPEPYKAESEDEQCNSTGEKSED